MSSLKYNLVGDLSNCGWFILLLLSWLVGYYFVAFELICDRCVWSKWCKDEWFGQHQMILRKENNGCIQDVLDRLHNCLFLWRCLWLRSSFKREQNLQVMSADSFKIFLGHFLSSLHRVKKLSKFSMRERKSGSQLDFEMLLFPPSFISI